MHRALFVAGLLASSQVFAQLDELENPGTVSAVQERAYRMHHELNLAVGILPLDAFYKGLYAQVGYAYHFSDTFAWQIGRGAYSYAARTGLREQLERDFAVLPTSFDEVQYFVGSDLMWKPFYGKATFLNKVVIHTELYLLLGGTLFRFTNAFRPGINIGGGARVYLSRYASLRLDLTNNIVLPLGGATSFINVLTTTLALAINFGGTE